MLELSCTRPGFAEQVEKLAVSTEQKLAWVAESAGLETVAYLRSFTRERRPPARGRGGNRARPAHPGHWADVTGELAAAYGYKVTKIRSGVRLEMRNTSGHAIYLEQRNGYFVLSGVTGPGGPLERALVKVMAEIAPEWTVVNMSGRLARE